MPIRSPEGQQRGRRVASQKVAGGRRKLAVNKPAGDAHLRPAAEVIKIGGAKYVIGRTDSFLTIYRYSPLDRVGIIKNGVAAKSLEAIADQMAIPKERVLRNLGLSAATINRKVKDNKALSPDESERAVGMARLVGQVQAMVEESGNPEGFNAAQWLARWIDKEQPALGGRKPAELLDTAEGQGVVSNLLARMQSGAYS